MVVSTMFLLVFHAYLRRWLTVGGAFAGTLFMAASWPATMKYDTPYPHDFLEATFFTLAMWLLVTRRYWYLPLLTPLATLNRKSIVFIVPAVVAVIAGRGNWRHAVGWGVGVLMSWGVVYLGLRLLLGFHPYYCEVFRLWDNMDGLVAWLARPSPITLQASFFALYGVFWIIGLLPMSVRPPELVRAAWMVPFHVGGAALIALIGESRIFVGLAPVLIPLGLWNLLPEVRGVELDDEAPQDAGGRSGIGGAPHAHEEGVNSPNDTTRGQH